MGEGRGKKVKKEVDPDEIHLRDENMQDERDNKEEKKDMNVKQNPYIYFL